MEPTRRVEEPAVVLSRAERIEAAASALVNAHDDYQDSDLEFYPDYLDDAVDAIRAALGE